MSDDDRHLCRNDHNIYCEDTFMVCDDCPYIKATEEPSSYQELDFHEHYSRLDIEEQEPDDDDYYEQRPTRKN